MSAPPNETSVAPRLAATVAILRDAPGGPEVLLTHRPETMSFGPGLHVFPGGRLDATDEDPRLLARLRPPLEGDPAGLHGTPLVVAAIREAWEEAGILFASGAHVGDVPVPSDAPVSTFRDVVEAHDLELRGDWLVPLSRWVTPPVVARRYDTRFFVAWLPAGATPTFDAREVAAHAWLRPADALDAMADGRIDLWTPTATTLRQLDGPRDLDDVRRLAPVGAQPAPGVSRVEDTHDLVTRVSLGGAGGVPGTASTAYIVGRRVVAIVDPGDPNDDAADAVLAEVAARGARVGAVLITAPVPERAAGAEGLALRLRVPVLAAADARRVLAGGITALRPGMLPAVADVAIRAIEVPGGLAYDVEEANVVFTGGADAPWPPGRTRL